MQSPVYPTALLIFSPRLSEAIETHYSLPVSGKTCFLPQKMLPDLQGSDVHAVLTKQREVGT